LYPVASSSWLSFRATSYDTTFNVGEYYLSTLVVKLPIFEEEPSFPVAFGLDERKF